MYSFLFAALALPAWFAWDPCLPYVLSIPILALGIVVAFRTEGPSARGLDKIVLLGPVFLAMPMAVFGGDHFLAGPLLTPAIPSWIPFKLFWVYFVGACLVAGALSLATKVRTQLTATLFGIMILLFEVLITIPRVVAAPGDRFAWAIALRDLSFSGGALALAGSQTEAWKRTGTHWLVTVGHFFIAVPILFFAIEQLLHPEFVPGVPLNRVTPSYVPLHTLWGYPTGLVYLVAGLALIANKKVRLASTWLGVIILLLVVIVYGPILIAGAADISNGLNYFADTLLLSGSVLCLAGSQRPDAATREGIRTNSLQGVAAD